MLYALPYEKEFSGKREEKAFQHELSQKLLGYALQREYGLTLSDLRLETGPHGKPFFLDSPVKFSLSHCRGLVCCLLGTEEAGVDAEPLGRPFDLRLAERVCTPEELEALKTAPDPEKEFVFLWTLKESFLKLTGEGFHYGLQNAAFSRESGSWQPLLPDVAACSFSELDGFAVSLCCKGKPPRSLELLSPETSKQFFRT